MHRGRSSATLLEEDTGTQLQICDTPRFGTKSLKDLQRSPSPAKSQSSQRSSLCSGLGRSASVASGVVPTSVGDEAAAAAEEGGS